MGATKTAEVKKKTETSNIDVWRGCAIPDNMIKDAFAALTLSILHDMWLSTDTKQMIFYGMIGNLEQMNHSEEDMVKFKAAVNTAFKTFHKPNDFMG
jgi:hypothetical protein